MGIKEGQVAEMLLVVGDALSHGVQLVEFGRHAVNTRPARESPLPLWQRRVPAQKVSCV